MSSPSETWPRPVTDHFRPLLHVVSSPDVDEFVRQPFAQLLAGYEASVTKVPVRNSNYESRTLDLFPVKVVRRVLPRNFEEIASQGSAAAASLSPTLRARSGTATSQNAASPFRQPTEHEREELFLDTLNETVASTAHSNPPELPFSLVDDDDDTKAVDPDSLFKPTPWYDAVKSAVLARREMAPWESFNQPLCVIVAVSMNARDPMSTLSALWDLTSNDKIWDASLNDNRHLWGQTDILRYVVLVRDSSQVDWESTDAAQHLHEEIRKIYGLHTGILALESDTSSEICQQAISLFMRELVVQSLVPFVERTIIVGNEAFHSARKGISGRLWGASKKYFGNSASNRQGSAWDMRGFYPTSAQESQNRRTADLAFMTGDYRLASSIYEAISKDYRTDNAWKFYSSSLRMAGLCHLLAATGGQTPPANAESLFAASFDVPSSPNTVSAFDAVRHAILFYDAYQALEQLGPAVNMLYRVGLANEEAYSGTLLEQAAFAALFADVERSSRRKFALYMLSASRAYEKAGVKQLSLQAILLSSIACPASWTALTEFMAHSTGRQAYKLGRAEDAVEQLLRIWNTSLLASKGLSTGADVVDGIPCLDDLELAWQQCERKEVKNIEVFDVHKTRIALQDESTFEPAPHWDRWEAVLGVRPRAREAVQGETIFVDLFARNPLRERLVLSNLQLDLDAQCEVQLDEPESVILEPSSSQIVRVPLRASGTGEVTIKGVSFHFHSLIPVRQDIRRKARRLFKTREHLLNPTYTTDNTLSIKVRAPIPRLTVEYALPDSMYAGETCYTTMLLRNDGAVPLKSLAFTCNMPSFLLRPKALSESNRTNDNNPYDRTEGAAGKGSSLQLDNSASGDKVDEIDILSRRLEPGHSLEVRFILRADAVGEHDLLCAFAYSFDNANERLSTRVRHFFEVAPSIEVRPQIRNSTSSQHDFTVSLQVTNAHLPAPVVITQLTTLSPRWRSSVVKRPQIDLLPGVSDGALLTVSAEKGPASELAERADTFAIGQLETILRGGDVSQSKAPPVDLQICSEGPIDATSESVFQSLLASHAALRKKTLASQNPTINPDDLHHIYPLFSSRSFDIVVMWTCETLGISGHSLVFDIPLGTSSNKLKSVLEHAEQSAGGIYAESQMERTKILSALRTSQLAIEGRPVTATVRAPDLVEHNFADGPCRTTITWQVKNVSASRKVDFVLSLHPLQIDPSNAMSLAFAGSLTLRGSLEPLSQQEISSDAYIFRPGEFDIGKWYLDATLAEGGSWQVQGASRPLRAVHRDHT